MWSKAEKFCSSEKCGESFFSSSVKMSFFFFLNGWRPPLQNLFGIRVIGCMWACIFFLVTECSAGVGSSFQRRLLKSARSCAVVVE